MNSLKKIKINKIKWFFSVKKNVWFFSQSNFSPFLAFKEQQQNLWTWVISMRYNHIQCLCPDVHLFTSLSIKSSKEQKWKAEVHGEKDKSFQSPSSTYRLHWIDKETSAYVLLLPSKLLQFLVSFKRNYIFLFIKIGFQYRHEFKNRAGQGLQSSKNRQISTSFQIVVFFQHHGSALTALEFDWLISCVVFADNSSVSFFSTQIWRNLGAQSSSQSLALPELIRTQAGLLWSNKALGKGPLAQGA